MPLFLALLAAVVVAAAVADWLVGPCDGGEDLAGVDDPMVTRRG